MIVSIISSILVWSAVLILVLRVVNFSGITMPNNKYTNVLLSDKSLHGHHDTTKKEVVAIFLIAFSFRIIVFLISLSAISMFNDNINSFNDILDQYMKWDANNYVRIATGGYTYYNENGDFTTLAFFPLYPWLMRVVNVIFNDFRLSGLITSFLLYASACCFLYKLFCIDYNKSTALRAIIYMSVYPHALFFGTIMNESLLLFTSAATLYYIRKHKWALVGIFGVAAALSRMLGVLLAIPAAVEWLEHYKIFDKLKNKKIKEVWKLFYSKGLWIFLMLLGTGIYLYCNYKATGDFFKFVEYQRKYWHHGFEYFGTGIRSVFNQFSQSLPYFEIPIPSVVAMIFVFTTIVYGMRRNKSMYTAFLIVYFIMNTSFDWVISIPRYMACAIPAFVFMSDFSERHKWTEPLITASMAIGFGIYFVAYLTYKQIL